MSKPRLEMLEGGKSADPKKTFTAVMYSGTIHTTEYVRELSLLRVSGFVLHRQLIRHGGAIVESETQWDVSHRVSGFGMDSPALTKEGAILCAENKLSRAARRYKITPKQAMEDAIQRSTDHLERILDNLPATDPANGGGAS